MSFDLGDYVEVKDRLVEAREKFPDHRFQSEFSVHETPEGTFVAVLSRFYRDADDPTPAVGLAWEPIPGKTPYTLDSELMNAETSAWGRALIAAGVADAHGGVASANEVRNRQYPDALKKAKRPSSRPSTGNERVCPDCGDGVWDNRVENDKREANGEKRRPDLKCRKCEWIQWSADSPVREDVPLRDDVPPPVPVEEYGPDEAPF